MAFLTSAKPSNGKRDAVESGALDGRAGDEDEVVVDGGVAAAGEDELYCCARGLDVEEPCRGVEALTTSRRKPPD